MKFYKKILTLDTETTGLDANSCQIVQLAAKLTKTTGETIKTMDKIVYPYNGDIPQRTTEIHGITTEYAKTHGEGLGDVIEEFCQLLKNADVIVAHNYDFDYWFVLKAIKKCCPLFAEDFRYKPHFCTMKSNTHITGGKWPKLTELYQHLFAEHFDNAHNALADVEATERCFLELQEEYNLNIPTITTSQVFHYPKKDKIRLYEKLKRNNRTIVRVGQKHGQAYIQKIWFSMNGDGESNRWYLPFCTDSDGLYTIDNTELEILKNMAYNGSKLPTKKAIEYKTILPEDSTVRVVEFDGEYAKVKKGKNIIKVHKRYLK